MLNFAHFDWLHRHLVEKNIILHINHKLLKIPSSSSSELSDRAKIMIHDERFENSRSTTLHSYSLSLKHEAASCVVDAERFFIFARVMELVCQEKQGPLHWRYDEKSGDCSSLS